MACPHLQKGWVRVELYDIRKTTLIPAHEAELAALALSLDGTQLATASEKGTLIRIFNTESGQLMRELRRGADRAEIYSIAFSANKQWLACSSDKGTIHVFSLTDDDGKGASSSSSGGGGVLDMAARSSAGDKDAAASAAAASNSTSSLGFFKGILPKYFSSEWSYAQFRIPETRTIVAFGADNHQLIVVGADGAFYLADFEKGGECIKKSYSKFVKDTDA